MQPYNELWEKRREVSDKLKALALQLVTKPGNMDSLQVLDSKLDDALAVLEDERKLEGRLQWFEDGEDHGNYRVLSREITPLAGHSNAVSPALHIWFDPEAGKSYGKVTCNWLFEGPPNCVHGGVVAALFDDFLGCTQLLCGKTGATGTLSLRYHQPTPLNQLLRFEGEVTSVQGRKICCAGRLYAGETLTVSGEGLFVSIEEGVMNLSKRSSDKSNP